MRRLAKLCRFKSLFGRAADGTHPIIGDIFKRGAGWYPPFWVAFFWVVGKAADGAYIFFHCFSLLMDSPHGANLQNRSSTGKL